MDKMAQADINRREVIVKMVVTDPLVATDLGQDRMEADDIDLLEATTMEVVNIDLRDETKVEVATLGRTVMEAGIRTVAVEDTPQGLIRMEQVDTDLPEVTIVAATEATGPQGEIMTVEVVIGLQEEITMAAIVIEPLEVIKAAATEATGLQEEIVMAAVAIGLP